MNKRNFAVLMVVVICAVASFLAWKYSTPAPFDLEIVRRPRDSPGTAANTEAVAGQRCVFLVVIEDEERLLQDWNVSSRGGRTTSSIRVE